VDVLLEGETGESVDCNLLHPPTKERATVPKAKTMKTQRFLLMIDFLRLNMPI
jgi:hypothetical protein